MISVTEMTRENQRLAMIRAGFIGQGTSFLAWCVANGVDYHNARKAVLGKWKGPKAATLIVRLLAAAGVEGP
ncbi:MAG: hypothetical protein U1B82_08350 [Cypionkella sp.]|nr:hypothetical protein [Cypionkella sp.]